MALCPKKSGTIAQELEGGLHAASMAHACHLIQSIALTGNLVEVGAVEHRQNRWGASRRFVLYVAIHLNRRA